MIKYLGSKRRLVPALECVAAAIGARQALDLFTGTTRVAQAFKRQGMAVTAVDSARYAETFARCYIGTDGRSVDRVELNRVIAALDALPGAPGYVTETFCEQARFFQPVNGARIDAIRDAIDRDLRGSPLEPLLLTSLVEAADRVDSTTGVQMAYVKEWAPRSYHRLTLRAPELVDGPGSALRGDAVQLAPHLGRFDLAYLDPPYNQHRYFTNYHVWETLVAWDHPEHYGIVCKRADARDPSTRSALDSKRTMPDALAGIIQSLSAELLVLSYNDEAWLSLDDLEAMCACRGTVAVLAFDSPRYVGARIGIHSPSGQRVGTVGRLRNRELLVLAGPRPLVERATGALHAMGAAPYAMAPAAPTTSAVPTTSAAPTGFDPIAPASAEPSPAGAAGARVVG